MVVVAVAVVGWCGGGVQNCVGLLLVLLVEVACKISEH